METFATNTNFKILSRGQRFPNFIDLKCCTLSPFLKFVPVPMSNDQFHPIFILKFSIAPFINFTSLFFCCWKARGTWVWRGRGVVNHCSNPCIMCTLSLKNEVTRLLWHRTSKHNYAAYKLQYSEDLASIYMALRANAVRPLGFRLPETFLQISGIISLFELETAPLQGFLLQKRTEEQKM